MLCILRIQKLGANLEIAELILRLCNMIVKSWDCVSTIHKLNRVTWWECLSWLTLELKALWDGQALKGALHRSVFFPCLYPVQEEESFSELVSFPKSLAWGAWVHAWHWWRWPACKSSLRMFLTFIHDGNLNHNLGSQQRLHDLKITHWCRAILRLCKPLVCNLETGSQFPDSETAQHNIYIAQMHRLCRTYIQKLLKYFAKRSSEASFRSSGALLWMERWCSSGMVPQTHVTFKTVYHIWEWVSKFCIVRLLCELVSRQGAWTTRRWGSSDI